MFFKFVKRNCASQASRIIFDNKFKNDKKLINKETNGIKCIY